MDHLFISDVHLGAFDDPINRRLENRVIGLVRFCAKQSIRLHILGDLFDYWMEYPGEVPELGLELLAELEQYNYTVYPATYILGNHDNWDAGFFNELGFRVVRDHCRVETEDCNIFLHHGDGLSEPSYQLPRPVFHRFLRNRWFTRVYQTVLPPDAGLNLMKTFSSISRERSDSNPDRLNLWSRNFLNNSTFDYVISGHDHIARVETFSSGTYINTGAFYKDSLVGYYTNNDLKLVKWSTDDNNLIPITLKQQTTVAGNE